MRNRNNHIQIWMNDEELAALTERAKECGYSREAYARSVLGGRTPRPMPPLEYHSLMRELYSIGNNMNQVAQKAHILNVIDAGRYDTAFKFLTEILLKIEADVKLPEKAE